MKKRLILIFAAIVSILFLTSCNVDNLNTIEKISAPRNKKPPINGQWKVEKYKFGKGINMSETDIKTLKEKEIIFYNKIVAIGDEFCFEPSYKTKMVDSFDYLLYHYKVSPKYLGIKTKKLQVINITSKDQFFCEAIKKDDDNIIVNIDGVFFFLTKVSDDFDDEQIGKYLEKKEQKKIIGKEEDVLRSGILLGLRYYDDESEKSQSWKYRTLWIRSRNNKVDKIYETEDLFLPRKSGFWKIGVERENIDGNLIDTVYAYPYSHEAIEMDIKNEDKKDINKETLDDNIMATKGTQKIQYLGNDYISIENIPNLAKEKKTLQVFLIDSIKNGKPIKISDIAGESGKKAFYEGATRQLSIEHADKSNYIKIKPEEESFSLTRRNGHWIMKGRVNYIDKENQTYTDFDIKAVPPEEIVGFDELLIPWNAIKLKVPETVDAYTSPNEDIAIVITYSHISIYSIKNNELEELLAKVDLKSGEKVVMAEWATGKYAYVWEDEFLKNEVNILD